MEVPAFIETLKVSVENKSDYPRVLRSVLNRKPWCITLNWKDDLFVLNSQRRYSDFSQLAVRQSNGIILEVPEHNNERPTIVAYSFNTIRDFTEPMKEEFSKNWDSYIVENIVDGAVMRLFHYNGQWNIATLKCVDARDANWSSKRSFYDLFEEAASHSGLDYSALNPQYCYTFIVRHPSNHMVIKYDTSSLIHLCTVNMADLTYVEHDVKIARPTKYDFASFEEFWAQLQEPMTGPFVEGTVPGFILTHKGTNEKIKVEKNCYRMARRLKGNCPNINYRILELLHDDFLTPDNTNCQNFLQFFPQYTENFQNLTHSLQKIVSKLYQAYNAIKQPMEPSGRTDHMEDHIMNELFYIQMEEGRRITMARVEQYVKSLSVFRLACLLKVPYYIPKNKNYNTYQIYAPRPYGHNQVYP